MTATVKTIRGHAEGTNMGWFCLRHIGEGFGFGHEPAITCIDMTIHSPENNKPQVLFSTYENPHINTQQMKAKFQPNAPRTWEQIALGTYIISNWDKIQDNDLIEIAQNEDHDISYEVKRQWKWEKK